MYLKCFLFYLNVIRRLHGNFTREEGPVVPDKRVTMASKVSKSNEMRRNHLFSPCFGAVGSGGGVLFETPINLNSVSGFGETDPFADSLGITVPLTIIRNNYLYFFV